GRRAHRRRRDRRRGARHLRDGAERAEERGRALGAAAAFLFLDGEPGGTLHLLDDVLGQLVLGVEAAAVDEPVGARRERGGAHHEAAIAVLDRVAARRFGGAERAIVFG